MLGGRWHTLDPGDGHSMDPWQESSPFQKKSPTVTVNCLDNSFVKHNGRYVVVKGAKHNRSEDGMPHPIEKGGPPSTYVAVTGRNHQLTIRNGEFVGGERKDKVEC
jgi:hypothetical protein